MAKINKGKVEPMGTPKLFTVEHAQKTLPLVKRIVRDIVNEYKERRASIEARRKLPARPKPGTNAEEEGFKLEQKIRDSENAILRFHHELADIGVVLKDYTLGLIDFFSRYEGRVVHLCWKLDDGDSIRFWHELNAGFVGRQPITDENRDRFEGDPIKLNGAAGTRKES